MVSLGRRKTHLKSCLEPGGPAASERTLRGLQSSFAECAAHRGCGGGVKAAVAAVRFCTAKGVQLEDPFGLAQVRGEGGVQLGPS